MSKPIGRALSSSGQPIRPNLWCANLNESAFRGPDAASWVVTRQVGAAVTTMTYSANGNLTGALTGAADRVTMTYDRENRLATHNDLANDPRLFKYDGFGRKRVEEDRVGEVELLWDDNLPLGMVQREAGFEVVQLYLSLNGKMVGEQNIPWDSSNHADWFTDFLGSIIGKMPASQTFEESRRFTPLGALLSGPPVPSATYAWTGNTGSRHTGLTFAEQYNLARHYSHLIGQWTTRDPLWPEERAYGYVNGNPVTFVDINGSRPRRPPQRPAPRPRPSPWAGKNPVRPPRPVRVPGWQREPTDPIYWPNPYRPGQPHPTPHLPIPGFDPTEHPDYWDVPLPSPGQRPAYDPVFCAPGDRPDPCTELANTKNRWCHGSGKRGESLSCPKSIDKNYDVDAKCNEIRAKIDGLQKCCNARRDEIRWRCFDPQKPRPKGGTVLDGHKIELRECNTNLSSCRKFYEKYCRGRYPNH